MSIKNIELDFGSFTLDAELFNTETAQKFSENLPYTIDLTKWGNEVYGSIGTNLGEENPIPEIPPGGLAYTNNGNYVCVFFGQTPAWSVEYIGQIIGAQWQELLKNPINESLTIRVK